MEYLILAGNFSAADYPEERAKTWREVDAWEKATKITLYVPLIFVSLVGNALVIVGLGRCGKLPQNSTNVYVLNLAVADMLVTLTSMWVHLTADFAAKWLYGPVFCQLNSFMQVTSLVASVLTMCSLAADRFLGVVTDMFHGRTVLRAKSAVALLAIWTCAVVTAVPLLVYTREYRRQWRNYEETWCVDNLWPSVPQYDSALNATVLVYPSRTVYYTAIAVLLYVIPLLLMASAYVAIILKLRKKDALILANDRCCRYRTSGQRKAIYMLILLLVVFAVCWLPFQFSMLYYEYNFAGLGEAPDWWVHLHYWSMYMSYANSALNPVIFIAFSTKTKQGIKQKFGFFKISTYRTTT